MLYMPVAVEGPFACARDCQHPVLTHDGNRRTRRLVRLLHIANPTFPESPLPLALESVHRSRWLPLVELDVLICMDELTPQPPPCALSPATAIDIRNYVYHLRVSSAARHPLRACTPAGNPNISGRSYEARDHQRPAFFARIEPVTSAQVEHGREPAGRFIPTQRREESAQGKRVVIHRYVRSPSLNPRFCTPRCARTSASHRETVAQPAQIARARGTVFAKPDVADDASLRVRYGLVRRHGGLLAGEARRPCLFAHRVRRAVGLR
ncbi:hypothetical protein PYCCODRAFT_1441151 [Trametes coccinea BRFM310]|uniref:Uncharacterized protein n=1 Tax=Trametes coccinea (strain BRFM310) TaxID=1353009 RepID=A0A1Y2I6L4_TRAC3|nr:hypothetical protein PYCCODRAFT_1441151 [Trametes coccinea BRFM310]